MKKLLKVLIIGCALFTGIYANEKLYVGTNAEFLPFEYVDNGEITGFDIDLIKKVGEIIGKDIVVKNIAFDGLLPALQAKKIDLIIAGMTVTPERKKFVDFSKDYFVANQVMIVSESESKIKSLGDLNGKKVGVVLGYTGDLVVSKIAGTEKIQYNSAPGAIMALASGKVDVVVLDSAPSKSYVKQNKGLKIVEIDQEGIEMYAIAVGKGQEELVNQINKALDKIKADGIYDELIIKYFK